MVEEKELDTIERAHLAAERLEKANKERDELIKRQEILDSRMQGRALLSGESSAGQSQPKRELTHEEKVDISTKSMFKGTAIESYLK